MKRKTIIALVLAILLVPTIIAFADDEGLIRVSGNKVAPGDSLDFNINLEAIDKEVYGPYSMRITLSPTDANAWIDVKENVSVSVNRVSGTYTISSADLESIKSLSGEIKTDSSIAEKTECSVSVEITGQNKSSYDEFQFTIAPKKSQGFGGGGTGDFGDSGDSDVDDKTVYKGSADNYLKSLTISGHELTSQFHKSRNTYFIEAAGGETSVNVSAIPCDKAAKVDIVGNNNVGNDMSKISIHVTAKSGDVRTYKVYVRH